jgi:palmitoyltransferase
MCIYLSKNLPSRLSFLFAVGYFNYRYFVNFLIYIFLGMSYGTAIMVEPFLLSKSPEYRKQIILQRQAEREGLTAERLMPMMPLREEKLMLTLSFMLCVAVGLAILLLGGFHIFLTLTGQTTIEYHGNWTARRRARAAGQKWRNPYSKRTNKGNWRQVYGTQYRWIPLSILPSRREPEFLPVPIPGHSGKRSQILMKQASESEHQTEMENLV